MEEPLQPFEFPMEADVEIFNNRWGND